MVLHLRIIKSVIKCTLCSILHHFFNRNPSSVNAIGFHMAEEIGLCSTTNNPIKAANLLEWSNCQSLPLEIQTWDQDSMAMASSKKIINNACDSSPPNCFQIGESASIDCCTGHFNRVAITHATASDLQSPDVIILTIENITNIVPPPPMQGNNSATATIAHACWWVNTPLRSLSISPLHTAWYTNERVFRWVQRSTSGAGSAGRSLLLLCNLPPFALALASLRAFFAVVVNFVAVEKRRKGGEWCVVGCIYLCLRSTSTF